MESKENLRTKIIPLLWCSNCQHVQHLLQLKNGREECQWLHWFTEPVPAESTSRESSFIRQGNWGRAFIA